MQSHCRRSAQFITSWFVTSLGGQTEKLLRDTTKSSPFGGKYKTPTCKTWGLIPSVDAMWVEAGTASCSSIMLSSRADSWGSSWVMSAMSLSSSTTLPSCSTSGVCGHMQRPRQTKTDFNSLLRKSALIAATITCKRSGVLPCLCQNSKLSLGRNV